MKKTLTVNLGGTVYHIDEDAYRLLDEYLSNLRNFFRKEKGVEEIVGDIENRISELFSEIIESGAQVITIVHVEDIIVRVGKPEELAGSEEDYQSEKPKEEFSAKEKTSTGRRLFRDPDNSILGGVFSGLAAYLGFDVTALRLVMLVLLFCSMGTMTLLYLICWIIIPQAKTATEKLSMRGEEINLQNIGKTVTEGFEKVTDGVNDFVRSDKPRSFMKRLADAIVTIIGLFLKVCLIILAIAFSPVLLVLAILFVVFIIAAVSVLLGGTAALISFIPTLGWLPDVASPLVVIVSSIAGILLIGIPLCGLVYTILRLAFKWKPMSSALRWTLVSFWFVATVVFLLTLAQMNWQLPLFYM
ncbi:PspC domain-containing protein [Bacteroides sp. OttesenSCG-928-J23]|nr:PspC domain-containing protein [Bacteroides sp. OttesenSCG-928-J23]